MARLPKSQLALCLSNGTKPIVGSFVRTCALHRLFVSILVMNKEAVRKAVIGAFLMLATACSSGTNLPPAQTEGQQNDVQLLSDIPIPANATMDNERSLILSDRDHWTGRVVMRFWHSTADLTNFYLGQMPAYGWQPVMSVNSEITILSYTRGDRAATVQIERAMMGAKSVVSITVAPRTTAPQPTNGSNGGNGGSGSSAYSPNADMSSQQQPVRAEPLGPPNRR